MRENSKFNEVKQAAYLDAIRRGAGKMEACRTVGVSHECVRLFALRNEEFRMLKAEAENCVIERVEYSLYQAAISGNMTACIFFLVNRSPPGRWLHRVHPSKQASTLTDEQLATAIREFQLPESFELSESK